MAWSDLPGWFGFRETYDEIVDQVPDGGVIVEVGVAFGRSLAYLARRLLDQKKHGVRVWAIDPFFDDWWMVPGQYPTTLERPSWGGEYSQLARDLGGPYSAFVHGMRLHAPEELERVHVLRCRSADAAQFIGRTHGVMIDANHDYAHVTQDIALWRPHMVPGGILAGDDFHEQEFPGVVRAVREAFPGSHEVRGTTWVVRT